jgi:hypothetical protein
MISEEKDRTERRVRERKRAEKGKVSTGPGNR